MYSSTGKCLHFHPEHLIQKLCNLVKNYVPLPQNNIWLGILGGAYYCNKWRLNFITLKLHEKCRAQSRPKTMKNYFFFFTNVIKTAIHIHMSHTLVTSLCIFHTCVRHYPSALLLHFHVHSSLLAYVCHCIIQYHTFFTANTTRFHTWKQITNTCSCSVFITLLH
jgi:hypothetical protein